MAISPDGLRQARLIAEHRALEKRMQNDSNIAYAVYTASIAAVAILLTASLDLYFKDQSARPSAMVLSLLAIILSLISMPVMERINATGEIRRARAVQIEKEIGFFSFRLFEPWGVTIPEDYFITLGEIAEKNVWDGSDVSRANFILAGRLYRNELMKTRPWSKLFKVISVSVLVAAAVLLILLIVEAAISLL